MEDIKPDNAEDDIAWRNCGERIRNLYQTMLEEGRRFTGSGRDRSGTQSYTVEGITKNDSLALIVEDDEDCSVIFSRALQEAHFDTEIIQSGDVALARLDKVTPDVVVLDMELPRVPGMEILRQIRANVRLAKTHVIIATAFPDLAEDLGDLADLVLIKPISFSQLRDLAARLSLA